jgi:hypothetical protein
MSKEVINLLKSLLNYELKHYILIAKILSILLYI